LKNLEGKILTQLSRIFFAEAFFGDIINFGPVDVDHTGPRFASVPDVVVHRYRDLEVRSDRGSGKTFLTRSSSQKYGVM